METLHILQFLRKAAVSILFDPVDTNKIYAGLSGFPSKGLMVESSDEGNTWKSIRPQNQYISISWISN